MRRATICCGDALAVLRTLPAASFQSCVTSPPYWGLRNYGAGEKEIGREPTVATYVNHLVEVFEEVRRVLREDGTLWLNLGDSYAHGGNGSRDPELWPKQSRNNNGDRVSHAKGGDKTLKPKDLCGVPWRVAFALQDAGWYLRSDCIWDKANGMPESVQDRPTKAHEYVFLFAKSERYFYDAEAVREPDNGSDHPRTVLHQPEPSGGILPPNRGIRRAEGRNGAGRNLRSVWRMTTRPFPEAHFASFPPELAERCIRAGSREGDEVLDPFGGAGTTAMVALRLNRSATSIELNPAYCAMQERRIHGDAPLLNAVLLT